MALTGRHMERMPRLVECFLKSKCNDFGQNTVKQLYFAQKHRFWTPESVQRAGDFMTDDQYEVPYGTPTFGDGKSISWGIQ